MAKMIPTIPNIVWIILCLTWAFLSTSATAYIIKPTTNETPARAIPTLKHQSVKVLMAFNIVSILSFNSLVSNKDVMKSLILEKNKISKPIISEEDSKTFEELIIEAYYMHNKVLISYYKNGYIYKTTSYIKKIDKVQKLIYLENIKLLFNQITSITPE